jgi:NhaP-type Na+/H+ or K+/H+ antiporter
LLPRTTAFAEAEGQLLTLLTFMLFGALVVADVVGHFEWQYLGYALVSLVVVRPLAVLLSLLGSGVKLATDAFVGWAGPRGLASIVYAVLIADSSGVPARRDVFLVAATTLIISIYLHGMTAGPVSTLYGKYVKGVLRPSAPELTKVTEFPLRLPPRHS